MTQRPVKADKVKTLADWVSRWPKATNIGFDPETREPTIYSDTKERTKVSSIPWKREADTLTVLSQPSRFSAQAVDAATRRFGKIQETRDQMRRTGEEQLRVAESAVLDAWRTYRAAPPAERGPLRREILTAEETLAELEAAQVPTGRVGIEYGNMTGAYVPPMPYARRGISMVAGASASE